MKPAWREVLDTSVLVGALGYFVDSFDLNLFAIVRVASLTSLGVPEDQVLPCGVRLFNFQMVGMLLGGLLWGVLGDRIGRRTVLFGSILLYSVATAANGLVHSLEVYAWLRLVAGIGMAGELGAAITLVSERVSPGLRGYATMLVASFGLLGSATAGVVTAWMSWRTAYFLGGGLGFLLLFLRVGTPESSLFRGMHHGDRRGDLRLLLGRPSRALTYLQCVLLGVPVWFTQAILIGLAPEVTGALGVHPPIVVGIGVAWYSAGAATGDLISGTLSQWLGSRKKALLVFLLFLTAMDAVYLSGHGWPPAAVYGLCLALGLGTGYWAVFVTVAAEQFGTNLRATVATTVPNVVRGCSVVILSAFRGGTEPLGVLGSAATVGVVCSLLALSALAALRETFARDLGFTES
ncbi:MAG: MFS transporter [Candidatus Eremiobacterota bacterium]